MMSEISDVICSLALPGIPKSRRTEGVPCASTEFPALYPPGGEDERVSLTKMENFGILAKVWI